MLRQFEFRNDKKKITSTIVRDLSLNKQILINTTTSSSSNITKKKNIKLFALWHQLATCSFIHFFFSSFVCCKFFFRTLRSQSLHSHKRLNFYFCTHENIYTYTALQNNLLNFWIFVNNSLTCDLRDKNFFFYYFSFCSLCFWNTWDMLFCWVKGDWQSHAINDWLNTKLKTRKKNNRWVIFDIIRWFDVDIQFYIKLWLNNDNSSP